MESRRTFLGQLGLAAAGLTAMPRVLRAIAPPKTLERVGIQLYTLRRAAKADLPGTLAQIAQAGYQEIEFWGTYAQTPAEIRAILDQHRLTAPSSHVAYEAIMGDPATTFATAHTLGQQWIVAPSLPNGTHTTADDWKRVAQQFNDAGKAVTAAGFRFAFHNHNDVVREQHGISPIAILMQETDPALVSYEMDLYWAVSGGADPLQLLAAYPGRFTMFHIKDGRPPYTDASQTDLGAGTIDFKPIFARAKGIEHYFVESDSAADPMAFAAAGRRYLATLEF